MKVLITGSTGFLGKNLAENLSGKYDLLLPGHKDLDLLNSEAVKKYLAEHLPDVLIHTAGVGITRTDNTSSVLRKRIVTVTRCACAWRTTLVRASCATRKQVIPM
jgi:dTDP-4-dehydrorhamnose reductase